ncbi:hypothetical protein I6F26_31400 [Ensifer sp. IC3342]|nr:hypothetical protein [Ensifer sp. BRP08]MCA1450997.1 hypothetical protein [Ensifer sp. IC3342]
MEQQQIPLRVTAVRFVRTVRIFVSSDVGLKAKPLFGALMALLCGLSALNVVNNYVGRNFMTAIAGRQMPEFIRQAIFYIAVFAVLTVVGAFARFAEERLALLWRDLGHDVDRIGCDEQNCIGAKANDLADHGAEDSGVAAQQVGPRLAGSLGDPAGDDDDTGISEEVAVSVGDRRRRRKWHRMCDIKGMCLGESWIEINHQNLACHASQA